MIICYPSKRAETCNSGIYTIPDSVIEICEWAFSDCVALNAIIIPDSVTEIGEGAFYKCRKLEKLEIPDSVSKIDDIAFRGCEQLREITVPESVIEIGWGLFSGCAKDLVVKCSARSKMFEYCVDKQINYEVI